MSTITPDRILQTGFAFWPARTLLTAVEFNVFGTLAAGPLDLETARVRLDLHERGARDFLDALVALGFLDRDDAGYRNTPETDAFLDPAKPGYIGGILEMCGRRLYDHWNRLGDGLRTGKLQNEARHGAADHFAELYADPQRLEGFLRAMSGVSRGANVAIAAAFPWKEYKTFADLGTAQGDLAVQIAKANPHLNGVGLDLPAVKPIFDKYACESGVCGRVEFVAGDFFRDPLPAADVYLMGHILHDWNLAEKRMLLKKCYDALPAGGAVIVYDSIIDDARRQNAFGLMMSLNMLIETPGGFDYTAADCTGWMRDAGFRETRVEHLVGPDSMVVGVK